MPDIVATKSSSQGTTVSPHSSFLKQHPLVAYFVLAFVITWLIWGLMIASAQGIINIHFNWWHLGAFGPLVAALIVTGITGGGAGVRELVGRMFRWRVEIKWILVTLLGPVALFALAVVILRFSSGVWPDISQHVAYPAFGWFGAWLLFAILGMGEEAGWRGFALPRLQTQRSALSAALILGVLWALWHLPIFFFHPGMMQILETSAVGGIIWVIGILTMSILFTWLYNSARGSILMAALVHGGLNTITLGGGEQNAGMISAFVLVAAIILIVVFRPANLSRSAKQTI